MSGNGRAYVISGGADPGCWLITAAGDFHWTSTPDDRPYAWVVAREDEVAFAELIEMGYVELSGPGWRFTTLGGEWIMKNVAPGYEAQIAILSALRVRGIAVRLPDRLRIMTEEDPGRLERWLKKAAIATSVDEVLREPI
jgi:hypothetical protein